MQLAKVLPYYLFTNLVYEAAFRLGQNRKTCPFFDQNIVNNNDVIYGHCIDGQKFYVVKKGQKSDKISVF